MLFSSLVQKVYILLGVIFLNFWIWKIIREDPVIAILLITLTFLLFQLLIGRVFKILVLIIIVLFSILSFIMLRSDFDRSIQTFTPEDEVKLNDRHFYYARELGGLFLNRKVLNYYKNYSLPVYKFEHNLFSNLDLNLYFFASHPRERAGAAEFEKYSFIFLPIFIIGVILLIYERSIWAAGYLVAATIVSAFVTSNYTLGPILFFPLINVIITLGIMYIFKISKKIWIMK